jgi:hypothetical protein
MAFASVDFGVAIGNAEVADLGAEVTIIVDISDALALILEEDMNPHRIVAVLEDGTMVGGSVDPATGLFTFTSEITGSFTIAYVESVKRLTLSLDSYVIADLAGNAETQVMDIYPVIVEGRTILPVRFISEALGADVGWNGDTNEVTLTIGEKELTFAIGEMAPGMDVPAQLMEVGDGTSRTMVPARFISEFFGAVVNWDDATRSIEIIL